MLRQAFYSHFLESEKHKPCLVFICTINLYWPRIKGSKLAALFIQTAQTVVVSLENVTFSTINEVTPYSPDRLAIVLENGSQ